MASIVPKGLIDVLRSATPEYLEDARDHLVAAVGCDRLVDHLNHALEAYRVRVFHGTRVTPEELRSIAQHGLRALKLSDRRDALAAVFSQHPEWADKARLLGEELHRFGPGWEKAGAGKREDSSVHVCLSRAELSRSIRQSRAPSSPSWAKASCPSLPLLPVKTRFDVSAPPSSSAARAF